MATITTSDGQMLPLSGGAMTGPLILYSDPTSLREAATKQYVDKACSGFLPLAGGTLTGNLNISGIATVGTNTIATSLQIKGPVASQRILGWYTGTSRRWALYANTTPESATNIGSDLDLISSNDTGGSLGVLMRFTRATGSIAINPNRSFTNGTFTSWLPIYCYNTLAQTGTHTLTAGTALGVGGASPAGFWQDLTFIGTLNTGSGLPDFNVMRLVDKVVADRALPFTAQLNMSHTYAAGASGDRGQVAMMFSKQAPSADGGETGPLNLLCFMHYDVGDSTDPAVPKGRASGVNFDTRIGGTGNAVRVILVQENDLRVFAGNTVKSKGNIGVHNGVGDAVHGSDEDYAISFSNSPTIAPGTGGNVVLLQLSSAGQAWPLDPTRTDSAIMQVKTSTYSNLQYAWQPNAAFGIDFHLVNFQKYAWRSTGHWIDASGQLPVLGPGAITFSNSGMKISVPNLREVSATIATGGLNYLINDIVMDAMGGVWKVAAIIGGGNKGAVASVTLVRSGYSPPVANPVSTAGGCGTGLTLNITSAVTGTLTLGDFGQRVNMAGLPTSNVGLNIGDLWNNNGVLNIA